MRISGLRILYHLKMPKRKVRELTVPTPGTWTSENDGTRQKGWTKDAFGRKF